MGGFRFMLLCVHWYASVIAKKEEGIEKYVLM